MRETHLEGYALDRYEIREFIGEGGFGEVYRAWATDLHIDVAVKVLKPSQAAIDGTVERFAVEARKTAHLQHSNIVTTYAYGECNGWHYIAMKLLEGETLAERITRQRGPLPLHETARVIRGVSNALDHAHGRGLVHRDVKPQNIFLERDGGIILTDFGLVKELQRTSITVTQAIIGTAEYISPEQVRGVGISGRSDIYALGHVAYEALTGQVAFPSTSGNPYPTLMAHVERDLPPLHISGSTPAVTQAVDAVLRTATAKAPEARFASAGAFATALEQAAEGKGGVLPPPPPPPPPPDPPWWLYMLAGFAGMAVVAWLAYRTFGPGGGGPPQPTPTPSTTSATGTEAPDSTEAPTRTPFVPPTDAPTSRVAPSATRTIFIPPPPTNTPTPTPTPTPAPGDVEFFEQNHRGQSVVELPLDQECAGFVWKITGAPTDCKFHRLGSGDGSQVACVDGGTEQLPELDKCFTKDVSPDPGQQHEEKMEYRFYFRLQDGTLISRSVDIHWAGEGF